MEVHDDGLAMVPSHLGSDVLHHERRTAVRLDDQRIHARQFTAQRANDVRESAHPAGMHRGRDDIVAGLTKEIREEFALRGDVSGIAAEHRPDDGEARQVAVRAAQNAAPRETSLPLESLLAPNAVGRCTPFAPAPKKIAAANPKAKGAIASRIAA